MVVNEEDDSFDGIILYFYDIIFFSDLFDESLILE